MLFRSDTSSVVAVLRKHLGDCTAFREFTAKTLTKEQRPSIRKVLAAAKQKAAQQPKRAKEKIKQRGLER